MSEEARLISLLGKTPEEAITELNKRGPVRCGVRFTRDPRSRSGDDHTEKRVIRIRERDGFYELLVGLFPISGI